MAAALVVLFHLGGMFALDKYFGYKAIDGPFAWGDAGVDFFFVLSGFIITYNHRKDFGQPGALRSYFFKRTLRIFPTYWLVCGAVFLAALAVPSIRQALPTDPLVILKALALIPQDPAVVGGTGSPIMFVAWSLQYEILFYAVVAVAIANRLAGLALVGVVIGNYLGCHFGTACGFPKEMFASHYVLLFGFGVLSAYFTKSRLSLPRPLLVALAGMALFAAFGVHETSQGRDALPIDRRLVYGFLSTLIVVGLTRAEDSGELVVRNRLIALLGDSSYALYLIHIPIISVLCKVFSRAGFNSPIAIISIFVFCFLLCVAIATVVHLWIERPMLRFFGRLLKTKPAPEPVLALGAEALPDKRLATSSAASRTGPKYSATLQ